MKFGSGVGGTVLVIKPSPTMRRTLTIAAACRILEIDRATLIKWHDLGYIRLIVRGPAGHEIRRVPTSEVARLRPAS